MVSSKHCISEFRKITNLTRIRPGPDGACSQQTIRDLEVTLSTLKHIVGSIENISPEYVSKLDMASLTILVVENVLAKMRDGNDVPLILQFAHRLSSTLREHLKRNATCSLNYVTSSSAFYSEQLGVSYPVADPDLEVRRGPVLIYFPCCLVSLLFLPKIREGPHPPRSLP